MLPKWRVKAQTKELRNALEQQFKYKFYHSTEFPFLHSIGIKHVIQGFDGLPEDWPFIGILHLYWTPDGWDSEWLNKFEDALELSTWIQKSRGPYNEDRLIQTHIEHVRRMRTKQERMDLLQQEIEEVYN